jgi:threonine dehydratase
MPEPTLTACPPRFAQLATPAYRAILEDQPRVDAIIVPLGGGSGAAGACIVAKGIRPAPR